MKTRIISWLCGTTVDDGRIRLAVLNDPHWHFAFMMMFMRLVDLA